MLISYRMLIDKYSNYKGPAQKIMRMIEKGEIFKLTKGLYETDKNTPGYFLANAIYGPSYLSFDFALAYHGLIPEAVYNYTSATFRKKKKKEYKNTFGTYYYQDIPDKAFPFEIMLKEEKGYTFLIATPEKALCDKLYTVSPVKNKKELFVLLFEDLRIDESEFEKLNASIICELCDLYNKKNLHLLKKVLVKKHENSNTRND